MGKLCQALAVAALALGLLFPAQHALADGDVETETSEEAYDRLMTSLQVITCGRRLAMATLFLFSKEAALKPHLIEDAMSGDVQGAKKQVNAMLVEASRTISAVLRNLMTLNEDGKRETIKVCAEMTDPLLD